VYLAKIAHPDDWRDASGRTGWIPVIIKRELRWAKPCFQFGVFAVPTLDWVRANHDKYSVWIAYEDVIVRARGEDSPIWVGFVPNTADATTVADNYPDISVEFSSTSWEIKKSSRADNEFWDLSFKKDGAATPVVKVTHDGTEIKTVVHGDKVDLHSDADQDAVRGNELKDILSDLIDAIGALTVPTGVGPSGLPINKTQFDAIKTRLDNILSTKVTLK
jgi:hypothetical protein